jgi:hypothetical protein
MSKKLSVLAHGRIAIALFALLLISGSSLVLSACGTSGGLKGTVASIDLATATFVLTPPQNSAGITSVTVSVGPQTEFRGALHGLSDLTTGMSVSVQGAANTSSGILAASKVEDEHEANDQVDDHGGTPGANHDAGQNLGELKGTAGNIDSAHSSFVLQFSDGTSKAVTTSAQTEFEGTLHRFADLTKGERVEVKGTPQADGSFAASSVEGENEDQGDQNDDANEAELTGTIGVVDAAHSTFILTLTGGSKPIVTNGQTAFDGGFNGFSDLKSGMRVEVRGTAQSDGSLLATRVHREDDGDSSGSSGSDGHDGSGSNSGSSSGSSDTGDDHGGSGGHGGDDGSGGGR